MVIMNFCTKVTSIGAKNEVLQINDVIKITFFLLSWDILKKGAQNRAPFLSILPFTVILYYSQI